MHELEGTHPFRAEQLGHTYFPRLAPVGAVGGEGDIGAAKGEVLSSDELGVVCKDMVVGLEHKSCQFWRGDDDGGDLAKLEVEDGGRVDGRGSRGCGGAWR